MTLGHFIIFVGIAAEMVRLIQIAGLKMYSNRNELMACQSKERQQQQVNLTPNIALLRVQISCDSPPSAKAAAAAAENFIVMFL